MNSYCRVQTCPGLNNAPAHRVTLDSPARFDQHLNYPTPRIIFFVASFTGLFRIFPTWGGGLPKTIVIIIKVARKSP